ncbi:hypothetical protein MHBO_002240 [Bonamia ostreae]
MKKAFSGDLPFEAEPILMFLPIVALTLLYLNWIKTFNFAVNVFVLIAFFGLIVDMILIIVHSDPFFVGMHIIPVICLVYVVARVYYSDRNLKDYLFRFNIALTFQMITYATSCAVKVYVDKGSYKTTNVVSGGIFLATNVPILLSFVAAEVTKIMY